MNGVNPVSGSLSINPQIMSTASASVLSGSGSNAFQLSSASGAGSPSTSASSGQLVGSSVSESSFLQLMSAELQYQDPTDPVSGTQMIAQLAQFANLAASTSMEQSLQSIQTDLTGNSQGSGNPLSWGVSLIGKSVTGTSSGQSVTGVVTQVATDSSGNLSLTLQGGTTLPWSQVTSAASAS